MVVQNLRHVFKKPIRAFFDHGAVGLEVDNI